MPHCRSSRHHLQRRDRQRGGRRGGAVDRAGGRVGALLSAAQRWCPVEHLATSLGWELPRTCAALDTLEARLTGTGQRLARNGDREVHVVPAVVGDDSMELLARRNITFEGVSVDEARLLQALALDKKSARKAPPKVLLHHLRAAGLVDYDPDDSTPRGADGQPRLTDAARYGLCLD